MARCMQILVGMIASGKSSYSANAAKAGLIIVNDDAIVNAVHGNQYVLYQKTNKILYKSTEQHIAIMAISLGKSVVIDRGLNVSRGSRQRWTSLAKSLDIPCVAIVFQKEAPEIHAQRRYQADVRGQSDAYWLEVARRHASVYEEPTISEGFDYIKYVSFEEIQKGYYLS